MGHLVVLLHSLVSGYAGENYLGAAAEAVLGMRHHRANGNLQIAPHYLTVDGDLGSVAGGADIAAVEEGDMIEDRETGDDFLAQLFGSVASLQSLVVRHGGYKTYLIILDTG